MVDLTWDWASAEVNFGMLWTLRSNLSDTFHSNISFKHLNANFLQWFPIFKDFKET